MTKTKQINKTVKWSGYNSNKWKRTRELILNRDNHSCKRCGNDGTIVHHIDPIDKSPQKAYRHSNLMTLCKICHLKIHIYASFRQEMPSNSYIVVKRITYKPVKCHLCDYKWKYRGDAKINATCPSCCRKTKIRKGTTQCLDIQISEQEYKELEMVKGSMSWGEFILSIIDEGKGDKQ